MSVWDDDAERYYAGDHDGPEEPPGGWPLSLDHDTVATQLAEPADASAPSPWHARRAQSVGASELAIAGAILGALHEYDLGKGDRDEVKRFATQPGLGLPRWIARKAGLRRPLASERPGPDCYREHDILDAYLDLVRHGQVSGRHAGIDPDSVRHASSVPHEWMPLARAGERLTCTPDAWARDDWGDLVTLDCKRTGRSGPTREQLLKWRWQIIGQCAVTGAAWGAMLVGVGWVIAGETGPVEPYTVVPTAAELNTARDWAARVWAMVDAARAAGGGR